MFLPRSSATSPRSPGSFYWRVVLRTQIWALGVVTACEVSCLQALSGDSTRKTPTAYTSVTHLSPICLSIYLPSVCLLSIYLSPICLSIYLPSVCLLSIYHLSIIIITIIIYYLSPFYLYLSICHLSSNYYYNDYYYLLSITYLSIIYISMYLSSILCLWFEHAGFEVLCCG